MAIVSGARMLRRLLEIYIFKGEYGKHVFFMNDTSWTLHVQAQDYRVSFTP